MLFNSLSRFTIATVHCYSTELRKHRKFTILGPLHLFYRIAPGCLTDISLWTTCLPFLCPAISCLSVWHFYSQNFDGPSFSRPAFSVNLLSISLTLAIPQFKFSAPRPLLGPVGRAKAPLAAARQAAAGRSALPMRSASHLCDPSTLVCLYQTSGQTDGHWFIRRRWDDAENGTWNQLHDTDEVQSPMLLRLAV